MDEGSAKKRHRAALSVLVAVCVVGCGAKDAAVRAAANAPLPGGDETPRTPRPTPLKNRATGRPGNHEGLVFVAEWHHILKGKTTMHRAPADFEKDLERLYKDGFRPVTATEYLTDKMDLPPGASPVMMTFDDSNPSQIQLTADGKVTPDCAVGIWQKFAATHPDFPVHGTFFVLPDVMWSQPKLVAKKVALLEGLGSELANHTMTHPILRKLSDEKATSEIVDATARLRKLGIKGPISLALPYGVSPKNKKIVPGLIEKGVIDAAFLVGANPAPPPDKIQFARVPRIQAYDGPYGLTEWLGNLEKGKVRVYVQ